MEREATSSVVLVVAPFASAKFPALGPSILAAACRELGLDTTVVYANLDLAARLGLGTYEALWRSTATQLAGEAVFRSAAFAERWGEAPLPPLDGAEGDAARVCHAQVPAFVAETVEEILALGPRIVGFSSVFQQNLASIALARALKARQPGLITVLGGANASRPMGEALAATTDAFDHIFSGEADVAFPRFCRELLAGERNGVQRVVDCDPITELDQVAVPEYDDYFRALARWQEAGSLPDTLPVCVHFESSRGCWWGEHSHCTFCGLNGVEMSYRSKTPRRLLDEIDHLVETYGVHRFNAVDNIMPRAFADDVLPQLARRRQRLRFFYEVKANLKPADLDEFVRAGVHSIQPGIESFSSATLRRLAKGVKGAHNLRLLRDCGSRTIRVAWNLLAAVPGERRGDYETLLRLIPLIEHLQPPAGIVPIRIDRFSPYANAPERYGIHDVEPMPAYRELYPPTPRLGELAYHFLGRYPSPYLDDDDLRHRLGEAVGRWRDLWSGEDLPPRLAAVALDTGSWYIEDTRAVASEPVCLAPASWARTLLRLEEPAAGPRLGREETACLPELMARGYVTEHEGLLLSLVCRPMLGLELHQAYAEGE